MKPLPIANATRILNKPADWDEEKDGPCGVLHIRDECVVGCTPVMISHWLPTAEELERLNKGAAVELVVCGYTHPPVAVGVAS